MSIKEFKLPDPGEGLTEAEIVTWKVKVGDMVKVNDIVVEIETAKSLVELPVPFAGRVEAILAAEGEEVVVGRPIITIQTDTSVAPGDGGGGPSPAASQEAPVAAEGAREPGMIGSPAPKVDPTVTGGDDAGDQIEEGKIGGTTSTGRTAVLVGYGVKQTDAKRRPRTFDAPDLNATGTDVAIEPVELTPNGVGALAKPPVRKLAKDLGVDLAAIAGSGTGGIVTRADVESAANGSSTAAGEGPAYSGVVSGGPGMPFAAGARGETRTPIKGVRKVTAQAM
ncbi:MAG: biotin/lipoyl-containing protein, partial [Nostocoides sp.]